MLYVFGVAVDGLYNRGPAVVMSEPLDMLNGGT